MPLTNSQYYQIMKLYDQRQAKARQDLEKRTSLILAKVPEYRELSEKISALSLSSAGRYLEGDESALASFKKELSDLRQKKEELLSLAGFTLSDLSPSYFCPDCKDTGYIGHEKCHCFKRQIVDLLYEQSNIKELLKTNNFSTLSYEYYSGEDLERFKNSVRACKDFIVRFNFDYHNLFFYGTVGTGKSFLSGCIAKELIDLGHSVIYFSASGLFERLARNTFHSDSKEELTELYEDLYSCDLLIIDDLGTEITNHFSSSQFFSCLNERILRKKSIIISTNLSLQDLRDRYSDRIFSRITSSFDLCKITGPDIRMQRKRLSNRK